MADGTQEWTEFTVPTAPLVQDTITEPTEEYTAPDVTISPSTLTMTATLVPPVEVVKYDTPAGLAGVLTLNAPNGGTTVYPTTLALTGNVSQPGTEVIKPNPVILSLTATLEAPVPTVTFLDTTQNLTLTLTDPSLALYSLPATVAGLITVNQPTPIITHFPTTVPITMTLNGGVSNPTMVPLTLEGTLGIYGPTPIAITTATTLNLSLTVNQPTPIITQHKGSVPGGELELTISAGFAPTVGSIQPTIVRYIKDPIVTGGCPQCGTFLYKEGAKEIRSEAVYHGRNFEIRGDDDFVRCGRCGFILEPDKHPSHRRGSRTGWGMRYTEVEAGESDISYP